MIVFSRVEIKNHNPLFNFTIHATHTNERVQKTIEPSSTTHPPIIMLHQCGKVFKI